MTLAAKYLANSKSATRGAVAFSSSCPLPTPICNTIRPHRVIIKRVKPLTSAAKTVRGEGARGGGTRGKAARTESTRTPQAGWHWGRGWKPRESNPGTSQNWTERQPRSRLIYLCPDTSPRGSCPSPARIRDLEHVLSCPVLVVVAQTANLGESRSRPSCTRRPRTYGSTRFPWLIVRVR